MLGNITPAEEAQLMQTIEMFEVITQSQPADYQSLEILKEAYFKLGRQKDVINTAKRIAQAYMSLGQLSSAILEYETILQRYPDDLDVLAAIADIESKANSLTGAAPINDTDTVGRTESTTQIKKNTKQQAAQIDIDDGKSAMQKLFVEGRHLSQADFNQCWPQPPLGSSPGRVIDPFIHVLAEKTMVPIEKSLKILAEKTRLGFLPMERYDVDLDTARGFPKDICQRWCVLPFDRLSKSVFIATANPFNKQAAEELQTAMQTRLIWYLSPPADLIKVIRKVFR